MKAADGPGPAADPAGDRPLPLATAAACFAGVLLIGWIDYATGVEPRVFPLYYVPIACGAMRGSRALGAVLAVASTALWALAMVLAGTTWGPGVFAFNTLMQLLSFLLVAVLVSHVARGREVERDLGRRDALTGLMNSRAFFEMAGLLLEGARRSGRPFTVAYVDLDNFKAVNDRGGHQEGDRALRVAAEVLRRGTRKSDLAARLGGDEFAVLLPETGAAEARVVLERIGAAMAESMAESGWPVTATVGAVVFPSAPSTLEEALKEADERMYGAKRSGKNRVVLETAGGGA